MLVIEIVEARVPTSGFIFGLPSLLVLQFSRNMKKKKKAWSGAAPRFILGAEQPKKDKPGSSGRLFWGAEGVGTELKITQERTRAAHALPHVDTADGRV